MRARGFTLIELVVALFIAAIMFAMGYGAINQALNGRSAIKEQQAQLLELQTAVIVLEQDFIQLAPRPVRQAVGDEPAQPALQGAAPGAQLGVQSLSATQSGTPPIVALTRAGWANPAGLQRPGLQRVAYFLENDTLRRESWNVLDPTLASVTVKRALLKHVKSFTLRYLDVNHTWQDQWPPLTSTVLVGPAMEMTLRERPLAVEITIDSEDWGKIVRILEIAG
ncbi:MAG: type II secretion system minor pseudopilin GspJ [Gammaproteobacteria bacterium]|nr:type II secretion system minor pseudopilin GspJ [Gammaproteobacteria bacterium]